MSNKKLVKKAYYEKNKVSILSRQKERRNSDGAVGQGKRAAYAKEYKALHPGYEKKKSAAWYARNKDRLKKEYAEDKENIQAKRKQRRAESAELRANESAQGAKWRAEHPGYAAAVSKAWYAINKEKVSESGRVKRAENPGEWAAKTRRYNALNPGLSSFNGAQRRKAAKIATPPWVDFEDIKDTYRLAKILTDMTGVKHHVDHVYPLKHKLFSGLNVPWNLGVVPAVVNLRKHNNVSPEMLRTSW